VVVLAAAVGLGMTACAGEPGRADAAPAAVALPPPGAAFDYQLGGAYAPPEGVKVVVRDSTAAPAPGTYSVCYVNGFQTQPGAVWPRDLVLHDGSGVAVVDPGWPAEKILDISTAAKRAAIADRHTEVVKKCRAAGYQAVEFDNLDSYRRSQGRLDLEDAVAMAGLLVQRAHAQGLAAAQKNTAELGTRGRDQIGFDFAVTEECDLHDECSEFAEVYGRRVLNIEYAHDLRGSATEVCDRSAGTPETTILRDLRLVTAGAPGYTYRRC